MIHSNVTQWSTYLCRGQTVSVKCQSHKKAFTWNRGQSRNVGEGEKKNTDRDLHPNNMFFFGSWSFCEILLTNKHKGKHNLLSMDVTKVRTSTSLYFIVLSLEQLKKAWACLVCIQDRVHLSTVQAPAFYRETPFWGHESKTAWSRI